MQFSRIAPVGFCLGLFVGFPIAAADRTGSQPASIDVPENVYRGELVSFPGPWAHQIGRTGAILVSDEQLEQLADPDRSVNLSVSQTPNETTLRKICEQARAAGQRTFILAFDHFFEQYRPGQGGKPRRLTPDKDEYVRLIAAISRFIGEYGLRLELSLLSPLEIGPAYTAATGEHGVWLHYREGLRDPKSGDYSVQLWRHTRWANNKGIIDVVDAGVRVFAYRETPVPGTPYSVVAPESIVEITRTAKVEVWPGTQQPNAAVRIRVHGTGEAGAAGLDRVLVVQMYNTPEMDYFSDSAPVYLRKLIDRYLDAGVKLNALYSDEMHIQQDWSYHNHHDHAEFALRYASPGLARKFAATYGAQYADLARYMLYFVGGQHDFATNLSARQQAMHVFGATPEAIRATALFRSRYYKFLQNGVVDLFADAKHYFEQRLGYRLEARAHATWAESPTCDIWSRGQNRYEYTPDFVWSNTVQQASAACYDYFKWGDFLTGNGNDHAEGGWLDRNYYGIALAASTGILNEVPNSYAALWGAPHAVAIRRHALNDASGAAAQVQYAMVQDMQHRDAAVLMLYPLDLVAADDRFGSWMSQFAYANYVTAAKLLERGRVANGAIEMAGRRFTTLVAEFEPFPSRRLLATMRQLAEQGGRVIWSGPPPVLAEDGQPVQKEWQDLFGVDYSPGLDEGLGVPGRQIIFEGLLAGIPPMSVLTDFIVDRVYTVSPRPGTEVIARLIDQPCGTHKRLAAGGSATVLGFRPRDDQSATLGYETRYWFEALSKLGAYPPSGRFENVNDNPEYLSRTTNYLVCRFPNGAVAVAPHLRDVKEAWAGGFIRDPQKDEAAVKKLKLPSEVISLADFKVDGHTVTFEGTHAVAFRTDSQGSLTGFCGGSCNQITVDGRTTKFADKPMPLVAWAPAEASRRLAGGAVMQIIVHGAGEVRIPAPGLQGQVELVQQGATLGSRGSVVAHQLENNVLTFTAGPAASQLYVIPTARAAAPVENGPTMAARDLLRRVVPQFSDHVQFESIAQENGLDVFELESTGGKVICRGSSAGAMSSALNWYLEHYCHCQVSYLGSQLNVPNPPPVVPAKIRKVSPHQYRYWFNYCTFSYSVAFWDWAQWERFIDWMALHGVNMPLAITGQEATWRAVGKRYNLNDQQMAEFLPGPAFLPFGWMGCLDGWGGPLPAGWINSHVELQKKILARERELGMSPVLQGFTGHVPAALRTRFPAAKFQKTHWGAFPETTFIDPADPLFLEVGKAFMEEQARLYGTDHFYASDTFIEMMPPSNDPAFLAGLGKAVYATMQAGDPQAHWIMMAWIFINNARFWQPPQAKALFDAVPDDRLILLEMGRDKFMETEAYYGKPWIWTTIRNYGNVVDLGDNLGSIIEHARLAMTYSKRGKIRGCGATMEGLGYDPAVFELVADLNWRSDINSVEAWLSEFVHARYGRQTPGTTKAWDTLRRSVYERGGGDGIMSMRPALKPRKHGRNPIRYDNQALLTTARQMLESADTLGKVDTYQYDVVNIVRQLLVNAARPIFDEIVQAHSNKDREALKAAGTRLLTLMADVDHLLATRREFLLGAWLADAKRWATNDEESRLYDWNARTQVTLWGPPDSKLQGYARKQWAGLVGDFYAGRWRLFLDRLDESLATGKAFDGDAFEKDCVTWEDRWTHSDNVYPAEPAGDSIEVARQLLDKYATQLATRPE